MSSKLPGVFFTPGCNCDFCHSPAKSPFPINPSSTDTLNYALDNSMKENARRMMRLTIDINKTYFYYDRFPLEN